MADTSIPAELRETERRVLGNLPAYRTEEGHDAAIESALEYGSITTAEQWPVGRTLADLTARLVADPHAKIYAAVLPTGPDDPEPVIPEVVVEAILDGLEASGLVARAGHEFRMTEAGLAALTA